MSHSMNVTVNVSDTATLSVVVTGDDVSYQLKKDGVSLTEMAGKLEGVNTPMLRVLVTSPVAIYFFAVMR